MPKTMNKKKILHIARPSTATLLKPEILHPSWSTNIDMSKINVSTLAEFENLITKPRKGPSLFITEDNFLECKQRFLDYKEPRRAKRNLPGPLNNERSPKVSAIDIRAEEIAHRVPSPCRTCTKNDEPERFHSHPKVLAANAKILNVSATTRNTVTKPVALKYKSAKPERPSIKLVSPKKYVGLVQNVLTQDEPSNIPVKKSIKAVKILEPTGTKRQIPKIKVEIPALTAYEDGQLFCKGCGKTFGTDEEKLNDHMSICAGDSYIVVNTGKLNFKGIIYFFKDEDGPTNDGVSYELYQQQLQPCPICKRKFYQARLEKHEATCRKVNHRR